MKKYPTIGCCGIDCGLCPRYYTKGDSVCPGCGGPDFREKHPSCGFHTCCAVKKEIEVCSACAEYPCQRFEREKLGYDSFVTHKKVFHNLDSIMRDGMESFIEQQNIRINILQEFLANYDDGRSKSLFCISCALLPLTNLIDIQQFAQAKGHAADSHEKNKLLKDQLYLAAKNLNIDLRLNTKIQP